MRGLMVLPILLAGGALVGGVIWIVYDREDAARMPDATIAPTPLASLTATPTALPSAPVLSFSPTPTLAPSIRESIANAVPFVPQAPFGQWNNPMYQDGCEEASILMAMRWVEGRGLTVQEGAEEIVALSEYEQKTTGNFRDTSAADTAQLIRDYFSYEHVAVREVRSISDIYAQLAQGSVVIIPADGRALKNPHFTPPGPERHMLVVTGYDADTGEFITNDPGTRYGAGYRYGEAVLFDAIRDYPTGNHLPITGSEKRMIVVRPVDAPQ